MGGGAMSGKKLPKGWRLRRLSEVLSTLESGSRPRGGVGGLTYGVPSIGGEHLNDSGGFDFSQIRYVPTDFYRKMRRGIIQVGDILLVKDGATTGKVSLVTPDWPFADSAVNEHVFILRSTRELLSSFLFYYLYGPAGQHQIKKTFHGSAQGGINQSFAEHVNLPVPPLPVQERIVEILQKADEIRRKRREALELADKILPALFLEMFGDPATNPKGWPIGPLNDLLDPGIERVNPALAFPENEFTYIEIGSVKNCAIKEVKRLRGAEAPTRARQVVRAGDVLYSMTRPNLRNIAIVPKEHDGAICTTGFAVLRPKHPYDTYFIFEVVKSDFFTNAMSQLAEAKSLYPAVDESQIRNFQIIHPPQPIRSQFGMIMEYLIEIGASATTALEEANSIFAVLLSRAFTGELTAEWEAANADWIAQQQALYERLPRLVVLALLAEKARRATATVLITALMKYVFLLQMEGSSARRRFYHFVPYHYGPFTKELYTDLEKLKEEGFIAVDTAQEGDMTRITLVDSGKAERAIADLPEDLKQDAAVVIEQYGSLAHEELLRIVYEKYPAYARKSRRPKSR
jgi:type I restriction enzyme S subunit